MKPYNTFRSIVFTLTTAFLFYCWGLIYPIIESRPVLGILFGGIVSLGSYRLILKIIEFFFLNIKNVKKQVFGNIYMEGIWVGCYLGLDNKPKFYIENFEQTLDELIIRGRCYSEDNSFKGTWVSDNVVIDENKGIISYTYETDMFDSTHKNQGLAVFNFDRAGKNKAPEKLIGFSSDIFTPRKLKSMEIKIQKSEEMDDNSLLQKAHELFNEHKSFFGL